MPKDSTNIPGCPHQDTFRTKPSDEVYRKAYNQIDWSNIQETEAALDRLSDSKS